MKKLTLILLSLLFMQTFNSQAQNSQRHQSLGNLTQSTQLENGLLLQTDFGKMQITVYAPEIVRIRATKTEFETDFSYAITDKMVQPEKTPFEIEEETDKITLKTSILKVEIAKKPLRITFFDTQNNILNQDDNFGIGWIGEQVTAYKKLQPNEKFIGLGEKIGNLNKAGEAFTNWNTDAWQYNSQTDPLYASLPFFIGLHNNTQYGIFFDNTHRSVFNFGASNNRFSSFSAESGEMNYYFIHQNSVKEIVSAYTKLTGKMTMPPLWSLGFQQCRYSYYPDKEVVNVARTFKEKQIPIDVLYLDIHYMDNFKVFTWHPQGFSQPQQMLSQLKNMGINVVIIIDPGVKEEKGYEAYESGLKEDVFIKYPDNTPYTGAVWAGWSHFPDFTKPKARIWWGEQFKGYVNDGVMGFWNDMNEPSTWGQKIPDLIEFDYEGNKASHRKGHNVFGLQMARSTYEGTRKLMQGKRPFVLTRSGYSGIQRYSAMWTGDNTASDENMLLGIKMANSMGITGLPFVGYDIGGFIGEPSKNLFARWITLGTFAPFMRVHTMIENKEQQPWSFGETVEAISRKYIQLRYTLLPYIYSNFYESTQNGLPIQRSLTLDYAHDNKIYDTRFQQQYLFGNNLLIAPCDSKQEFTKVYLPENQSYKKEFWYDFHNDKVMKNLESGEVIVDAEISRLPVFVRSGAIIPTQSVTQNTKEKTDGNLYLHIYANHKEGQISEFVYYEDDGETYNNEKGEFLKRKISYNPAKNEITIEKTEGNYISKFANIQLVLHGFEENLAPQIETNSKTEKLSFTKTVFSLLQPIKNGTNILADKQAVVQTVSFGNGNEGIKVRLR
jgi:alpha-glucosidase